MTAVDSAAIARSPIIVALDFNDLPTCLSLVDRLDPKLCRLKIGKEMFTLLGPSIIEILQQRGFEVFLDLKFHDIPATVAKAVTAAANLGVWMVNVHASGGRKMMEEAAEALTRFEQRPLLIGVTVLTSMSEPELTELGVGQPLAAHVRHLAALAKHSGLDGVVCSALEATALKTDNGKDFKLVTPGIRPAGAAANDQTRIMTPEAAMAAGSDYLVIGRPITQAPEPIAVCENILATLGLK